MKNNNKILIAGLGFVISIIGVISIIFILNTNFKNNKLNTNSIKLYYIDRLYNTLNYEEISLSITPDITDIVDDIFLQMKETPKTNNLSSAIPSNVELLDYKLNSDELELNLSKEYNSLSDTEKIFLKSSLVWTYTNNSILDIKEVNVLVNSCAILSSFGEVTGSMSLENVILSPAISPEKLAIKQAILYFSDESLSLLIQENKLLQIKQSQTIEYQIVEKLISGPIGSNYIKTVPTNTKIKNIKTEEGICYVDLSAEFLAKNTVSVTDEVVIYSIVNSLVELEEINRVQFLIDGKKVDIYGSNIDISSPLERNENIIFKDNDNDDDNIE